MSGVSRSTVQTLVRRIVKPSSPTPPHLSCYKLSRMDQINPTNYVPISFFFPARDNGRFTENDQLFSHTERSLAKVLSYYYPLAGRLVGNNDFVNCNDAGVELIRARMRCSLAEILDNTKSHAGMEDLVLPEGVSWTLADNTRSPLVAQVTHFECRGFAISLCMSHKITDGFGLVSFINDWAAITRQPNHVPSPVLMGASVFPPAEKVLPSAQVDFSSNPVTRRFIFAASEISKLKAMAIRLGAEQPTRVEVVTALLFHCAIVASGSFRPSIMGQALNLRSIVSSPAPENLFGNFSMDKFVYVNNVNNIRFEEIVAQIRKIKAERGTSCDFLKSDEQTQEFYRTIKGKHGAHTVDFFVSTAVCRFPFYGVDFGWGRPIRVCFGRPPLSNTFLLMDTPDGEGIEAMVTLDKAHMENFERNEQLLSFVAPASTKKITTTEF